ncbi:hypothetical protein BT93_B1899 [Corymbia citriodora subsp. variegata]|nr:hypothetical protein BT93_B1899 [Corymbia citriodora subsp. variegata]
MAIAKRRSANAEADPWDAHSYMMTWASSILLAIIFLIVLGVSIIWLTVHPRQLHYTVENALVSNFNFNQSHLVTADFNISLSTNNSNHRVSFTYESMEVSAKSHDLLLASAAGPALVQGKDNFTEFAVILPSRNVELQGPALRDFKETESSGDVKIDVFIEARVKFNAMHWKQDHCRIQVLCGEVEAHRSPEKAFQQTVCDVEL